LRGDLSGSGLVELGFAGQSGVAAGGAGGVCEDGEMEWGGER
jgi:hypothetical protein